MYMDQATINGEPAATTYATLIVKREGKVGSITLHRPEALNALNSQLVGELCDVLNVFDKDPNIGCIVITGDEKAFAAGADIKEMQSKTSVEAAAAPRFLAPYDTIAAMRKLTIAAVAGYALGGGCELAMSCDIVAAENAVFGQPEHVSESCRAPAAPSASPAPSARQNRWSYA